MTDYEQNGLIKEDRGREGCKGGHCSEEKTKFPGLKNGWKLVINSWFMSGLDKGLTDHQHYECKFCLHLFEGNKMLFLASQPFLALLKATTGWQSCAAGEQRAGGYPETANILVLHYLHLSYGKVRNVTATFCACEQKETLEFNYYSCSMLPLSALCLFSIPPTTLGTASRFLFTQWPKSPQNLFSPRSIPTSARFGLASLCHSMAKLLSWSWQKHLEEG